jgi:hypothetical protein
MALVPLLILPMKIITDDVAEKKSFSCSGLGLPVLFSPRDLPSCVGVAGRTTYECFGVILREPKYLELL